MVDISVLEWVSISTNKHIWEAPLCVYYDRHSVMICFATWINTVIYSTDGDDKPWACVQLGYQWTYNGHATIRFLGVQ